MMKKSPQLEKLETILRSSKLSACGFMGYDKRNLWEIIDTDAAELEKLGKTKDEIAARMKELTDLARSGLGDWVKASENLQISVDDSRGIIPCPWPHAVHCLKTITTAMRLDTNISIRWSDLNIHFIKAHGFFEGYGSLFRLEPRELVAIIFT